MNSETKETFMILVYFYVKLPVIHGSVLERRQIFNFVNNLALTQSNF